MKLKSVLSNLVLLFLLLIFIIVGIRIAIWYERTSENFNKFLDFIDNTVEKDREIRDVLESIEMENKENFESKNETISTPRGELTSSEITDTTFPIEISADSIAVFKDSAFPSRESGQLEWIEYGPWDNFINSLENTYTVSSVDEIDASTTCIVIETYMCNEKWSKFYASALKQQTTSELNIVILCPYNSTNSNIYWMYSKYIDEFLNSSCYADTTITIYFYDDTCQTFYYNVD